MTAPDQFADARKKVAAQIERDTASAKADTRAEFRKVAEWVNRSMGQRVRRALAGSGR